MAGLKDFYRGIREGKLSRRELFSTAAKVGAGAAVSSMFPMSTAFAAGKAAEFPKRKVLWLTMVRTAFFVPVIIGEKEAAEFLGWETQFNAPEPFTPEAVVNIFMNYIEQKPDAISFAYVQPKIFDTAIQKAREAGIFLITFNTDAEGRKEHELAFVGQDNKASGLVNGTQIAMYAQKITGRTEGKIVINNAIPGHSALEERAKYTAIGVKDYNEKNGTNFVTEMIAASTNEAEYVSKVEAKYTAEEKDIVGFCGVDSVTFGIGLFIKARNLQGKIAGGGFDLDDPTLMAIKDGRLQYTIGQDPYSQGFVTSMLIWTALERGYPARDYYTGLEVVDASNIDAVIKRETLWKERAKEVGF